MLRLRDIDPAAVALEVANGVLKDAVAKVRALAPAYELHAARSAPALLLESGVYQTALALGRYAVSGRSGEHTTDQLVVLLSQWIDDRELLQADPTTEIATIVAGAYARDRLAGSLPLSAMDVALLVGWDRDHIIALCGRDAIPGAYRAEKEPRKPWRFRVNARFKAWLAASSEAAASSSR